MKLERDNQMELAELPVDKIIIDRDQPRQELDQTRLEELADTISKVGQIQPIIVQKQEDKYLLNAGERRYRAVKEKNEAASIMAVILKGEVNVRQIQLIENLQRQSLNPLERAQSIQKFINENELTKKEAARSLGVPRTTMTEWLNILEVKPPYQQAVLDEDKALSLSHITLAKGLANRTGDDSKLHALLDGVLKYNFSRQETKMIVDLFHKYLHMPMEEAFAAVLLKRENDRVAKKMRDENRDNKGPNTDKLINSMRRIGENIEEFMEEVGQIHNDDKKEYLLGEFLYIYQLLGTMIPELKKQELENMVQKIKNQ